MLFTQLRCSRSVTAAINKMGNQFAPNDYAKRNYAAATLRMLKCVNA
ncbi:hypothetical protein QUB16_22475 [Microcoleus sp. D3_18a_C4]